MPEELAQRILHTAPGCLDAAMDATRIERLAGDAGSGIDVGRVHPAILIDDPGHFPLPGAHVGRGHVLGRVDQVTLGELIGKAAGDELHFVLLPLARVDPEPALRAAERHFNQRALVGHQRGKRFDLVLMHAGREADTALDGFHVFGMNGAVAGEGVDRATQANAETHGVGRIAHPDLFLETG